MVGLIVWTSSSGLSNTPLICILYPLKQLFDWHIWHVSILHQIELISYFMLITMWIWIPPGLYIS